MADAEFALIGEVQPAVRRPEGPFGDHYGYYSLQHDYPVFTVKEMAHRADAIYPATVVGKPRQEDFFIGDLLQELLSPLFPVVMPAVETLWSYGETGYHSLAAAVVKQRYAREAMASAFRILGEGQLSLTKFLLVTDRAVDVRNFKATLEHILARTHVETDLYVFSNLSMDTLDYTGPGGEPGAPRACGWGWAIRFAICRASSRRTRCRPASPTFASTAAGAWSSRPPPYQEETGRRRAPGARPGLRGVAARGADRRRRARHPQRHQLPVDHFHALRAGGGHRRRGTADCPQPRLVLGPDRDRRPA